jgi:predicted nucleic acid-binding protein
MPIVVDSNILIVYSTDDARRSRARTRIRDWIESGDSLHAPTLTRYEVANALTRLIAAGMFPADRLDDVWRGLRQLPIRYHPLAGREEELVRVALRLGRSSAYDAAYLVLALDLGAELWTFDGPLARNAVGLGFPVHLIG